MDGKLSVNNPGLADLRDPNSSTKIAELYDSAFDNEWVDALECLTHQGTDEESGVRFLLDIMKHIYSFCTKAKKDMMQELQGRLANPISGVANIDGGPKSNQEDQQIKQMLDSCVKLKAKTAVSNLHKGYSHMKSSSKPRYADRLPEYVSKCIEICWLMNTLSPSLIFAEPLQSGENIDKDQYKEYTQQGHVVSFVVWLPLLLEQEGAVLSKGVVQPIQRSRTKTSSKSASVRTSSKRETPEIRKTRDGRFKEVVDEVTRDLRGRTRYDYDSRARDRDPYNNNLSGDRLHVDRHMGSRLSSSPGGSRLSPTPTESSVDELFQDSYSPTVTSHTTSKNFIDKTTTSRISGRPTPDYSSNRKTAVDYPNERARTIGGPRPESGKASNINPSEIFSVGGHNYIVLEGRIYKQDPIGEWHFSRDNR